MSMQALSKRLAALEQRLVPSRPIVFYQEDINTEGLFRRGGDRDPARRLRRDELAVDAGADAIAIIVIYEQRNGPVNLATDAPVVQLPDNGRTEEL